MPRAIAGKGLRLSLRLAPCAHICRYCLISETRKGTALPWERFEQLGHRFIEWKESCGHADMSVGFFIGPSYDFDLDVLQGLARLRAHRGDVFETLNLGGLRIRRGEELSVWLESAAAPASPACMRRWPAMAKRMTAGTAAPAISNISSRS